MRTIHAALVLAVVGVVVNVGASGAWGQVLVQGGEALDANNRAGSGGYNSQRRDRMLVNPNDVALGNATGGRQFRGRLTPDPSQPFGGRSNLPSDRFARRANPAVTPANPNFRPSETGSYVQPYYSTAPQGLPPAGFVKNPYLNTYQAPVDPLLGAEDLQYGVPPGTPIVRPDAAGGSRLVLPQVLRGGPGVENDVPMVMTASPLLGVRELPTLADEERFLLSRSDTAGSRNLDTATIRQLRNDLRQSMLNDPRLAEKLRQAEDRASTAELDRAKQAGMVTQQPLGSGTQLLGSYLPRAAVTQLPTGVTDVYATPDPSTRNPLLMALRKAEEEREAKAVKEAAAEKKGTTRPARAGGGAGAKAAGGVEAEGEGAKAEGVKAEGEKTGAEKPVEESRPMVRGGEADKGVPMGATAAKVGYVKPVAVESLSTMQTQKGLRDILGSAEKLMSEGKYASAADQYEVALRYAPGDETIVIGRAHAELAGGFFVRAYESLRRAVASDPSVLGAQYDLRKAVGEARLQTIVSDLKKLALENPKDARPLAVLAYVSYNAGQEERAIALLDEAAKRGEAEKGAGKNDSFVMSMRSRWQEKSK